MSGIIFATRCQPAEIWQNSRMQNVRVTHTFPTHSAIISIYGEELWATTSRSPNFVEEISFEFEKLDSFAIHLVNTKPFIS